MCIGGEPNQIPMQMGLIPTKTYKRVKKTQKSIVSGQNVPEGEVVEEKVVSEIINEDGTKKVIIKKTVHHKKWNSDNVIFLFRTFLTIYLVFKN